MSEEYEILKVCDKTDGGKYVTIPKNSEFFGEKYVKVVRVKE